MVTVQGFGYLFEWPVVQNQWPSQSAEALEHALE